VVLVSVRLHRQLDKDIIENACHVALDRSSMLASIVNLNSNEEE
jgi:pantothenate kinase